MERWGHLYKIHTKQRLFRYALDTFSSWSKWIDKFPKSIIIFCSYYIVNIHLEIGLIANANFSKKILINYQPALEHIHEIHGI